eukprot:8243694-Alexandrium_andersonii.AAC.1
MDLMTTRNVRGDAARPLVQGVDWNTRQTLPLHPIAAKRAGPARASLSTATALIVRGDLPRAASLANWLRH